MDNKNNKIREFLIIYAGVFLLLFGYFHLLYPKEAKTEEPKESISENEAIITPEDTEEVPYFSPARTRLSENDSYQMIVIDGVYYLIYESGYGASHSIAVTPMYNSDGTIKTEDRVLLQAPPANAPKEGDSTIHRLKPMGL